MRSDRLNIRQLNRMIRRLRLHFGDKFIPKLKEMRAKGFNFIQASRELYGDIYIRPLLKSKPSVN